MIKMFSLKNGLKLTWAHLHDEQMFLGWFLFTIIPSIAFVSCIWWIGIIWFVIANLIYILIRCWDDPVVLGWCEK